MEKEFKQWLSLKSQLNVEYSELHLACLSNAIDVYVRNFQSQESHQPMDYRNKMILKLFERNLRSFLQQHQEPNHKFVIFGVEVADYSVQRELYLSQLNELVNRCL